MSTWSGDTWLGRVILYGHRVLIEERVAVHREMEMTEIRTCREALRTLLDLIDSGAFMSNELLARCREVLEREDERVAQDVAATIAEGIE